MTKLSGTRFFSKRYCIHFMTLFGVIFFTCTTAYASLTKLIPLLEESVVVVRTRLHDSQLQAAFLSKKHSYGSLPFSTLSSQGHKPSRTYNHLGLSAPVNSIPRRNYIVRKSVRNLTLTEKQEYIKGVKALKIETDQKYAGSYGNTYDKYVDLHNLSALALANAAHRGPAFLPWHRQFLLDFEKDLQRVLKNSNYTLPYWDWEWDASQPDPTLTPVWGADFMGGQGEPVSTGPFTREQWPIRIDTPPSGGLTRAFGKEVTSLPTQQDINYALASTQYDVPNYNGDSPSGFRNNLEGFLEEGYTIPSGSQLHNRVHMWVGGSMLPMTSPNDPVFFLHHCNVDRIWAMWQNFNPRELNPTTTTYPSSGARFGHNLNDPMFPWNNSDLLPNRRSITAAQVLTYQDLYRYQTNSLNPFCVAMASSDNQIQTSSYLGKYLGKNSWGVPASIGTNFLTDRAPSFAVLKDKLYLAYKGNGVDTRVYITSQNDNGSWALPYHIPDPWATDQAPSMTSFNGKLYMAVKTVTAPYVYTAYSRDGGRTWNTQSRIKDWATDQAPSMTSFNGKLYMAVKSIGDVDPRHPQRNVWVASSKDGINWDIPTHAIPGLVTDKAPSIASFNGKLYLAVKAIGNPAAAPNIFTASSTNGISWTISKAISGLATDQAPSIVSGTAALYMAVKSIGPTVFVSHATNGDNWSDITAIPASDSLIGVSFIPSAKGTF